jgi:hypothetical protein
MTDTGCSSEPDSTFPWTIELALSGGGFRATAYALGTLLYLVHTGLNSKVRNISSVSGGSITNAFVACQCSYEACGIDNFRPIAGALVQKIVACGLLSILSTWLYISTVGLLFLCLGIATIVELLRYFSLVNTSWQMTGSAVSETSLLLYLLYFRSWPVDRWMRMTFLGKKARNITLGSLRNRVVDHVFCATELGSALPFFFRPPKEEGNSRRYMGAPTLQMSGFSQRCVRQRHFLLSSRRCDTRPDIFGASIQASGRSPF